MAKKKTLWGIIQEEACEVAGEYVKEKVTKRLIRIGEMSIAFLLAGIFLAVGIVELVGTYFPVLEGGWNYLVFGIIFLFIGLILK